MTTEIQRRSSIFAEARSQSANKTASDDSAMKESQVVLRVPTALKNKWVRASQAEGRKLTEWLIARIER